MNWSQPTLKLGFCAALLALAATLPSSATADEPPTPPDAAIATQWTRYSSFESNMNEGVDYGWRVDSPFVASRTAEAGAAAGSTAVEIATNGGNRSCSCPRMTYDHVGPLGRGDEFWMGGSWYVNNADKLAWSRLMNLGHFESSGDRDNWYFALFSRDPGEMEVVARNYNKDRGMSVLMAPRPIPEDRWFNVDIHARLSPTRGAATTDVYLDGELVAHSARANMWSSRALKFYNAGLSYFWPKNGSTTVYFDAPRLEW